MLPFIGFGTPERVRVRGRVVPGRASRHLAADLVDDQARARLPPHGRWVRVAGAVGDVPAGLAPFLTDEMRGAN